jgi:hypothetical protein
VSFKPRADPTPSAVPIPETRSFGVAEQSTTVAAVNPFGWDRPLDDPAKIVGMFAFARQIALTLVVEAIGVFCDGLP